MCAPTGVTQGQGHKVVKTDVIGMCLTQGICISKYEHCTLSRAEVLNKVEVSGQTDEETKSNIQQPWSIKSYGQY